MRRSLPMDWPQNPAMRGLRAAPQFPQLGEAPGSGSLPNAGTEATIGEGGWARRPSPKATLAGARIQICVMSCQAAERNQKTLRAGWGPTRLRRPPGA
jgi:hypothetical protein